MMDLWQSGVRSVPRCFHCSNKEQADVLHFLSCHSFLPAINWVTVFTFGWTYFLFGYNNHPPAHWNWNSLKVKNWPNSPLIIRMELMKPFEIFLWSCLLLHCIEVNAIFVLFVKYYIVVISMWDLAESLNGQKPQLVFFFLWVGTVSPVFGLFLRFGSLLSVPMRADDVIPFAWLVGWFLCK